ncbi:MAG: hypothetical protein O7F76_10955 [Planctomycetota bacterium]|nr:hypothetical protein [Planctomycetota bacterium]
MQLTRLFAIGAVVTLVGGCLGMGQRPTERRLDAPSGLRWVRIVANGIE